MRPWPASACRPVFCGDESDPPETDIYHPGGVYKYPYADDAYFMFPWVYEHWPESPHPNDGLINAQLAASRDGWHWMRYDRKECIPAGPKANSTMVAPNHWGLSFARETGCTSIIPAGSGATALDASAAAIPKPTIRPTGNGGGTASTNFASMASCRPRRPKTAAS